MAPLIGAAHRGLLGAGKALPFVRLHNSNALAYATIPIFILVPLVALLWDMWIPYPTSGERRSGTYGVLMSLVLLCAAFIALALSGPDVLGATLLGGATLFCFSPLSEVLTFARNERKRLKQTPSPVLPRRFELPASLVDADNSLKLRYDHLVRNFDALPSQGPDQSLLDEGRLLAQELARAAMNLGYSRVHEYSRDIPALTFWAADIARRSYTEADARRVEYENSLMYYRNFETTAWLWEHYQRTSREGPFKKPTLSD